MAQLNDLQIEFLSSEIQSRGIELNELHADLLDHICTAIESRMDAGEEFETAFQHTMKLFGPGGLMQVQEQTLLLLTQMNETMKKLSMGFGLAATALLLAGMLFKIQHWPGAGMLLVTGNFFLVAIYLPFLLVHKLKESRREDYPVLVLGFIGLALFACGSTFKIMHWPMGSILLWSGFLTLAIGFLPLYFYGRYRTSVNKSITLTTAMLVLIGMVEIGQLLNLKGSTQYYHSLTVLTDEMEDNLARTMDNESFLKLAGKENIEQFNGEATALIEHIKNLKAHLISKTEGISLEQASTAKLMELRKLDDLIAPGAILIGDYDNPNKGEFSAAFLEEKLNRFRKSVIEAYPEEMRKFIEPTLGFKTNGTYINRLGMEEDWKRHHFHHVSLASTLAHLTKLQWETSQAVNQALVYHTAQSEPPGTPRPGA